RVGVLGVLLFDANPDHPLEPSKAFGDRTTLPLAVPSYPQQYMLMEAKDEGREMVGLPPEAAASSFCS
ncbi:hypothetical protein P7K49_013548, partial [Saguinus oedipus]